VWEGSAVLIRAKQPLAGIALVIARAEEALSKRGAREEVLEPKILKNQKLASGPGKLWWSLGADSSHSGKVLLRPQSFGSKILES